MCVFADRIVPFAATNVLLSPPSPAWLFPSEATIPSDTGSQVPFHSVSPRFWEPDGIPGEMEIRWIALKAEKSTACLCISDWCSFWWVSRAFDALCGASETSPELCHDQCWVKELLFIPAALFVLLHFTTIVTRPIKGYSRFLWAFPALPSAELCSDLSPGLQVTQTFNSRAQRTVQRWARGEKLWEELEQEVREETKGLELSI